MDIVMWPTALVAAVVGLVVLLIIQGFFVIYDLWND